MEMKKKSPNQVPAGLLLIFLWLAAGCQAGETAATPTPDKHFIAPTSRPADLVPPIVATPLPTRQANCLNQLNFIDDLTIPDGTEVRPGQIIVKRWLIENKGSCNWNKAYSLQLISGLALGAETDQHLFPARQNTEAVLEITFSIPDNPGRYNTWWQAYDPDGNRFGDPVYMDISVVDHE
jgi:hypothetical protein